MFKVTLLEKTKITIANHGSLFRFSQLYPPESTIPKWLKNLTY